MQGKRCENYRNLVSAVTTSFQSIHLMAKAQTLQRCYELCGGMKQECLDMALQEKSDSEKPPDNA